MKKTMRISAILSLVLTLLSILAGFVWKSDVPKACAITFATTAYHFWMRLAVGGAFDICMRNRADYTKRWYQCSPWETGLYSRIKVKKWKSRLPSYDPDQFDPGKRTWEEIAQAMCQAEIVHQVIVVMSFIPLLFAVPFGSFWIFLVTSLLAACCDLSFVVMQRFNRPRILKFIAKERVAR